MKVAVYGLWHLGSVTAACLAEGGHAVIGLDPDKALVARLQANQPPVDEPGLAALISAQQASGRLSFTAIPADAIPSADIVWVCFDTPVDDEDRADVQWVRDRLEEIAVHLRPGTLVLISSQLPVGFGAKLEEEWRPRNIRVACSPENLRLGQALDCFRTPDRVVIGCDPRDREMLTSLFAPYGGDRVWMSVASAEMTKHAVNAFLATSVTFINELARICEVVGANAKDVERGLKTESRIGPRAYLSPGSAFCGGTLARDIGFLVDLAHTHNRPAHLFQGVRASNECQKMWLRSQLMNAPNGSVVAVLGLTYKPGTDTLRRSGSIELCHWLLSRGIKVQAHDPAVPANRDEKELLGIELKETAEAALQGADIGILATPWPEYRSLTPTQVRSAMRTASLVDPTHFLAGNLANDKAIRYIAAGRAA